MGRTFRSSHHTIETRSHARAVMDSTIADLKKQAIQLRINTSGMEKHELVDAVKSAHASHAARKRVAPASKKIQKNKRTKPTKNPTRELKDARQNVELFEHIFGMLGGDDPVMKEELEAARAKRDALERNGASTAA